MNTVGNPQSGKNDADAFSLGDEDTKACFL